jgi:exonuclease III
LPGPVISNRLDVVPPDNSEVRILAWNVAGGSRPAISNVVMSAAPDLVVLSECRPSRYVSLATKLRAGGFDWVAGTNQGDYTGLLIASKTPMQPGSTSSRVLPGHWCHVWLPEARISIVGIYGPLRRKGAAKLVPAFWDELIQSAKQLATNTAVLVGDLNTAAAPEDTTSGLPLTASKELQRLSDDGWRDVYREVHGNRPAYSYWEGRGAYRIDHAMLSPAAPRARKADYLRECAGYELGRWSGNPRAHIASDHAALLFEI